jgi:hypothetical protein
MVAWSPSSACLVRWIRNGSAGAFVGITKESARSVRAVGDGPALAALKVCDVGIHRLRTTGGETYNDG